MAKPLPILLMTRPRAQAEAVVTALQEKGLRFEPVYAPLIGVEAIGEMPDAGGVDGLIFTSANGVRVWAERGGRCDLPCYAVGGKTAEAVRHAGMAVTVADGDAEALVRLMLDDRPQGHWLHLHGVHSRGNVVDRLQKAGFQATDAVIYDQPERAPTAQALAALAGNIPVIAPLYSPRTAALFARLPIQAPLLVAGLSPAVVKPLATLHIRDQRLASRPDSGAMLEAIRELLESAGESVES